MKTTLKKIFGRFDKKDFLLTFCTYLLVTLLFDIFLAEKKAGISSTAYWAGNLSKSILFAISFIVLLRAKRK